MKSRFYLVLCLFVCLLVACYGDKDPTNLEETFFVQNEGAQMPVYMYGNVTSGTILLIIHGGPGGSGLEYRSGTYPVDLENRYGVAYWDQRGQGMSHGKYNQEVVNLELMTSDLNAVVDAILAKYGASTSLFLLGHSWGGMLSASFVTTESYQDKIAGWIEVDGAHDIPRLNREAVKMFISEADKQIGKGNSVDEWTGIRDWALSIDTNNISEVEATQINQNGQAVESLLLRDGELSGGEEGGIAYKFFAGQTNPLVSWISGNVTNFLLEEIETVSLTSRLSTVTIPCLFMWGKFDFVVPPQLGIDAFNEVSSTEKQLLIYNFSGHSPMNNQPQAFTDEVSKFIDDYR